MLHNNILQLPVGIFQSASQSFCELCHLQRGSVVDITDFVIVAVTVLCCYTQERKILLLKTFAIMITKGKNSICCFCFFFFVFFFVFLIRFC